MANTTNISSSQLTLTSHPSLKNMISESFGDGLFAVMLCPSSLFLEIIRINELRAQASRFDNPMPSGLKIRANETVQRVLEFEPEDWAHTQTSTIGERGAALWLLLGRIYQSAVALYAIASLQSLSVLGSSPYYELTLSEHLDNLVTCLRRALKTPQIKLWMTWPLVVAGLVVRGSEDVRRFVRTELGKLSRIVGSPLPLLARNALDRFWARGGMGWDGCFESAFAFLM